MAENQTEEIRGERWEPKPGDVLIGVVVDRKERTMGKKADGSNDVRELLVVEDRNKRPWTVWKTSLLEKLFKEVKKGDAVKIEYIGEKKGRHQRYKEFRYEIV